MFCRRVALLYGLALLFGLLAAFVVNDTVALMGPQIAYIISRIGGVDPRLHVPATNLFTNHRLCNDSY